MSNQSEADDIFDAIGDPMRRRVLGGASGREPPGRGARRAPAHRRPAVRALLGHPASRPRPAPQRGHPQLSAVAPDGLAEAQRWLVGLWDDGARRVRRPCGGAGERTGDSRPEHRGEPGDEHDGTDPAGGRRRGAPARVRPLHRVRRPVVAHGDPQRVRRWATVAFENGRLVERRGEEESEGGPSSPGSRRICRGMTWHRQPGRRGHRPDGPVRAA